MNLAVDVISSLISDRWYTRAWITQEALSAGSSLLLILHQCEDIVRQPKFSFKTQLSDEEIEWQSASSDNFAMPVDVLHETLDLAGRLLPDSIMPRPDRPPTNIRTFERSIPLINRTREAHIRIKASPREDTQWLLGAADKAAGARYMVDAATALGLLSSRHCRDVQDRIAIVSNMCNFHIRLNTAVMARQCKSLKLALLTLAIANGDYSLLVPEVFAIEHSE